MDAGWRKARLRALLACYENDLSGDVSGVYRHPRGFLLRAAAYGLLQHVMEADPRLTSTALGATAVDIAKQISVDSAASKNFLDIEIVDDAPPTFLVTFEKAASYTRLRTLLTPFGNVAVLCKPDDKIAPGVVAAVYAFLVEPPQQAVQEARHRTRRAMGFDGA